MEMYESVYMVEGDTVAEKYKVFGSLSLIRCQEKNNNLIAAIKYIHYLTTMVR